jgi:hypothetical protein
LTYSHANGGLRVAESQAFRSLKSLVRLDIANRMGEILFYGGSFGLLVREVEKLVIFQLDGGPWAIRTVPPVLIRIKLK